MRRLILAVPLLAAAAVAYLVFLRPWFLDWGSTAEERARVLPGDELWPDPAAVVTRAVTVHAPAAVVWRWAAQIGQDRAGFYSYRALENLAGCRMPEGRTLLGLPDPRPGDRLWLGPKDKWEGQAYLPVLRVDPGRAVVHQFRLGAEPAGIWGFHVVAVDAHTSRFLVRSRAGRAARPPGLLARAASAFLFDPVHFAMERRMLLGLQERAEGRAVPEIRDTVEVALWASTALAALSALLGLLLRHSAGSLVGVAGTALALLTLLFFARPPLWLGGPLVLALWAWLARELRVPARR